MPVNAGVLIAEHAPKVVRSASVTTRQLFVASFDALMRLHGASAVDLRDAIGISDATLSKFTTDQEHIKRWPKAEHFDAMADFFGVQPYVLLKPDEALSGRTADRSSAPVAQPPSRSHEIVISSAVPPLERSQDAMPDAALFRKLTAYWAAMDPARHAELVRIAWELSAPGSERPSVGFKAG